MAPWRASSPLCPVALTEPLLKEGRHTGHGHLFNKVTQGRKGRSYIRGFITYTRARMAVREAMPLVGLKCGEYGLHSLRSGGASEAAAAGVPHQATWRLANRPGKGCILRGDTTQLDVRVAVVATCVRGWQESLSISLLRFVRFALIGARCAARNRCA